MVERLLQGVRVLAVDDDKDSRALVRAFLARAGAEAVLAASAAEAYEKILQEVPDVVVSDIGMPGEDGYQLVQRVRELPEDRGGHVPAVALTAWAREEDQRLAFSAGFQAHMAKPVNGRSLVALVARLAGRETYAEA